MERKFIDRNAAEALHSFKAIFHSILNVLSIIKRK